MTILSDYVVRPFVSDIPRGVTEWNDDGPTSFPEASRVNQTTSNRSVDSLEEFV